ncbi:hypothetical protein F4802DRAFT_600750 [Xylaria palmicola]|nr:hypothetical protein F4802DRAFT_600750 [Xylaria palmicola]
MIQEILSQQLNILNKFIDGFEHNNPESLPFYQSNSDQNSYYDMMLSRWEKVKDSRIQISRYQARVRKIDSDAERIQKTIQDQLNLKRTHASMRDAEAGLITARAGLIVSTAVIGFTIITVVFAPLAFVSALFALPVDTLLGNQVRFGGGGGPDGEQQEAKSAYTTAYVRTWFAVAEVVTLAITMLFILLCLWIIDEETVRDILQKFKRYWNIIGRIPQKSKQYLIIIRWILFRTDADISPQRKRVEEQGPAAEAA